MVKKTSSIFNFATKYKPHGVFLELSIKKGMITLGLD
jgi:hypothetical protein